MNVPSVRAPEAASLPLARLLNHTADAVQAVRAGHSLTEALLRCPAPARPGTQALSFFVLRRLGAALGARALLVPKTPTPSADALLLTSLALLWPEPPGSNAVPPYAEHTLVDQAVEAARQRAGSSAPFVNAVLRRLLRERVAIVAAVSPDPVARFNHPQWWIDRLKADWPVQWQAILQADNQHPPMTLRVNARRGSATAYLERLAAQGLAARALGEQAVQLERPCAVTALPGFGDGDVSVQDVSAQRAAPLLVGSGRLRAGARVLDACAAPGGKTAHLLELADLEVVALDSDATRLSRVLDNLARLGLSARTVCADAADTDRWWDGQPFDAVLLDAPCTASGILRRHPDVRWLRRHSDIAGLVAQQRRLLDALWRVLRPGGRLLFCTCSVFRAEGAEQIDAFLQRYPDARRPVDPPSPGHLLPLPDNPEKSPEATDGAPPDGFFLALIEKS